MRSIIPYIALVLLVTVPVAPLPVDSSTAVQVGDYAPVSSLGTLDEDLSVNYTIRLMFLGFNQTSFNMTSFQSQLIDSYSPIDRYPSLYSAANPNNTLISRTIYNITYDMQYASAAEVQNYMSFLRDHSSNGSLPAIDEVLNTNALDSYENALYVNSSEVEEYLYSNFVNDDTPTLFLINNYEDSAYYPYYYNTSVYDIDLPSDPRQYGTEYRIAGGGQNHSLLWVDPSAGPTYYRGSTWRHISNYSLPGEAEALGTDLGDYTRTAIELRFIPSYIYSPVIATEAVEFEFLFIDLTNNTDWSQYLDPDFVVGQYSRSNPELEWNYTVSEWGWTQDPGFVSVLTSSYDNVTHDYDGYTILSYLDSVYQSLFNSSTPEKAVVPVFLFGFPEDRLFDLFLGIATNDGNGNFTYMVGALNEQWTVPGYYLSYDNWYYSSNTLQNGGYYQYVYSDSYEGGNPSIFKTSLTVNATGAKAYVMDTRNFQRFQLAQPFTPLVNFTLAAGTTTWNTSVDVLGRYYFVLQNYAPTNISYTWEIDRYTSRNFGLTFVTMHEAGHGLGLSHPHDGWSDFLGYGYLDWLWDLSYTQMTYAGHHNNVSYMDLLTLQRGQLGKYFSMAQEAYNQVVDEIDGHNIYYPTSEITALLNLRYVFLGDLAYFRSGGENLLINSAILSNTIEMIKYLESLNVSKTGDLVVVIQDFAGNSSLYSFTLIVGSEVLLNRTSVSSVNSTFTTWVSTATLEVYVADTLVDSITINLWETELLIYKIAPPPPPTSSETSSDTSSETSSEISSDTSSDSGTPGGTSPSDTTGLQFLQLYMSPVILAATSVVLLKRRKS